MFTQQKTNYMNVTYLIGNGFDLHLGMKTSFKDICAAYIIEKTGDDILNGFKCELEKDAPNYCNWSDFEISMGKYSENFENFEDFKKCVSDFRQFMISYLSKEEKEYENFLNENHVPAYAYKDFITNIYNSIYLSPKESLVESIKSRGNISTTVISFNYTTIFDKIMNRSNIISSFANDGESIFHIHGVLGENIRFGVDNEDQIKNEMYRGSKKCQRLFVKTMLNNEIFSITLKKIEETLSNSEVIVVYGMSFGNSDMTWKKYILNWLMKDKNHILFYFWHGDFKNQNLYIDDILNREDDLKKVLLNKMGCSINKDSLADQIVIPVNKDIMDFTDYVKKINSQKPSFISKQIV